MDNVTYQYDNLGRLKKLIFQNGTTYEFFYDSAGNRTSTVIICGPISC